MTLPTGTEGESADDFLPDRFLRALTATRAVPVEGAMHPVLPFRWDLAARLPDLTGVAPTADPWPGYRGQLLEATAQVVRALDGADPVFVGRSCESIFDLLEPLLAGTRRAGSARLLLFSAFARGRVDLDRALRCESLRANLAKAGLDPARLIARERPVALVDVVASGETLGRIVRVLARWCEEIGGDWPAVCRKLRVVALRDRSSARFDDWRDDDAAAWRSRATGLRTRDVLVGDRLWRWLADEQPKVTPSHTPDRWEEPEAERPDRAPRHLAALRAALDLRAWARTDPVRAAFARWLAAYPGLRRPEVRALVHDLRVRRRRSSTDPPILLPTSRNPTRARRSGRFDSGRLAPALVFQIWRNARLASTAATRVA